MRNAVYIIFVATMVTSSLFAAPAVEAESTIYWSNGDQLKGELVSATDGELKWNSPLFTDPFQIGYEALNAVVFPKREASASQSHNVRLQLRGGHRLFGTLVSLDSKLLILQTSENRRLQIHRGFVEEIVPTKSIDHGYLGPNNLEEWEVLKSRRGTKGAWAMTTSNALRTTRWGSAFLELKFHEQKMIEVELTSNQRPQFVIGFHKKVDAGPRLETWDDEVVLVNGDDFEPVETLTNESRHLHYRIYRDHESDSISVTDKAGKVLGKLQSKKLNKKSEGLYLRNKGYDLTLRNIRTKKWSGELPEIVDPAKSRLIKNDGTALAGEISGFSSAAGFQIGNTNVPLDSVDSAWLERPEEKDAPSEQSKPPGTDIARAAWHDGTWLVGRLIEIDPAAQTATFSATWEEGGFQVPLSGMRKLSFPNSPKAKDEDMPDLFSCSTVTLHGHISGGKIPTGRPHTDAIHWRPFGSKNSSAFETNAPAKFTVNYREEYLENSDVEKTPEDRIFLTNNDVVSARMKSLDGGSAKFTLAFSDKTTLNSEHLRAVELTGNPNAIGALNDGGWITISEDKEQIDLKEGGKLTIKPNGIFGHPTVLSGGDEIAFRMECSEHSGYSSLILFADKMESDFRSEPLQIGFYFNGNRLYLQAQRNRGAGMNFNQQVPLKEQGKAEIKITLRDPNRIVIYVNGVEGASMSVRDGDRSGRGLIFANTANGPFTQMSSEIRILDFAVKHSRGALVSQQIDAEAKAQALTVPRFRRDRAPTHALIARNGDLLRGSFEGMTESSLAFISRLEDFTFPRERIGAIVWLKPPLDEEVTERTETNTKDLPPVVAIFDDGSRIGLSPSEMTETHLLGKSTLLGECKIDRKGLRELRINERSNGKINNIPYQDWQLTMAPEPVLPSDGNGSGAAAQLVGKEAPKLKLPILGEENAVFDLGDHDGKVVVLDFWATWCGPCIRAMPDYLKAMDEFNPEEAIFVGVNQGENEEIVSEFLVRRDWFFPVVLDSNQTVGSAFGVEAIPHTVIVAPDGKIAWVHTGFRPEAAEELKAEIHKLLNP